MRKLFLLVTVVCVFAGLSRAGAETTITDVRVGEHGGETRIVLDLTQGSGFQLFTLGTPYRVVIDIPKAAWALSSTSIPVNRGLVRNVRFGRFNKSVSRVVVDLNAPVAVRQAFLLPPQGGDGHRVVIDIAKVASAVFQEATLRLTNTDAIAGSQETPAAAAPKQTLAQREAATRANNGTRASGEISELALTPPPETQAVETRAEAALSRATAVPEPPPDRPGVDRPVIVIDPGHGGGDPGAVAPGGILEKEITLAVGVELARQLRTAGYPVRLTREGDRFISLSDRVDFARNVNAGLFVSLHADSHPNARVKGAAVYTLSDKASDKEAERLASRENKADLVNGVDLADGYDEEVTQILISLVQQSTMNCSATFAAMLVPSLGKVASLLGRTHRFAGFKVLKAPDVPSVLVELGYMSNKRDRARLLDKRHQRKLAAEIAMAIDRYVMGQKC